MAYDIDLAERLRELLAGEPAVTEKKMFGGLAFMVGGHMSVSASGHGGLMLRVDPAESDALVADPQAELVVMRGREMPGWLHVQIDTSAPEEELNGWVERSLAYVHSLPPK
jgi:TfoX/Sxy family transcriptional regulator of competence genes